jgi:hypothetical protein
MTTGDACQAQLLSILLDYYASSGAAILSYKKATTITAEGSCAFQDRGSTLHLPGSCGVEMCGSMPA